MHKEEAEKHQELFFLHVSQHIRSLNACISCLTSLMFLSERSLRSWRKDLHEELQEKERASLRPVSCGGTEFLKKFQSPTGNMAAAASFPQQELSL